MSISIAPEKTVERLHAGIRLCETAQRDRGQNWKECWAQRAHGFEAAQPERTGRTPGSLPGDGVVGDEQLASG